MTGSEPHQREPGPDASIDDIQADIEQTRKELGQTVDALSAKLDVKERTQHKAAEAKERITQQAQHVKDDVVDKARTARSSRAVPVAAVVVVVAAIVGIVIWSRRR